jgi:hypothetical protein
MAELAELVFSLIITLAVFMGIMGVLILKHQIAISRLEKLITSTDSLQIITSHFFAETNSLKEKIRLLESRVEELGGQNG